MRVPGAEIVAEEGPNRLAGLVAPQQAAAAAELLRPGAVRFVSCLWWRVGAGWRIPPRALADDFVLLPVRGEIEILARSRREPLAPGQVAVVPEGLLHAARFRPGHRALDVVALHLLARTAADAPLLQGLRRCVAPLAEPARWQRDLAECCALHAAAPELGGRWGAQLGARLLAELAMAGFPLELPPPAGDERIAAALAALAAADGPPPGIAELARRVGLAPTRFRQRFAAALGCAPKAWIDRERLRRAAELLRGPAPLREVARAAGFGSLRQFLARFRAAYGRTPTAWRRGGGDGP